MARFEPPPATEPPPPDAVHPREATAEAPTSVARLNETIRDFVRTWSTVWVEGEITSWERRGANVFGGLRDLAVEAQLSFSVWSDALRRMPADLKVGDRIVACVKADYFVRRGTLTFQMVQARHVGLGDQLERLEQLRRRLLAEGLFDPARKRRLPFLPRVIGLITGERSDAERDVHRNAELRWPQVRFRTVNTAVQGERSVPEILDALAALDADPEVDVIVIARGGGDPQDLLGFSDERLLRAVAAAGTPVVSAIGHEADHPLLDDVADLRASTPTDAAKRVVPDVAEQRALVRDLRSRATTRLIQRVQHDIAQLEQLRSRPALRAPEAMLTSRAQELVVLTDRGRELVRRLVDDGVRRTAELRAGLRALSPAATLERGYAIAQDVAGRIVRDPVAAPAGTPLALTLARGRLAVTSAGEPDDR